MFDNFIDIVEYSTASLYMYSIPRLTIYSSCISNLTKEQKI